MKENLQLVVYIFPELAEGYTRVENVWVKKKNTVRWTNSWMNK
jgi:hypothetical protein